MGGNVIVTPNKDDTYRVEFAGFKVFVDEKEIEATLVLPRVSGECASYIVGEHKLPARLDVLTPIDDEEAIVEFQIQE